jgi:hypothetical protein
MYGTGLVKVSHPRLSFMLRLFDLVDASITGAVVASKVDDPYSQPAKGSTASPARELRQSAHVEPMQR